jgi:hypothetical protein
MMPVNRRSDQLQLNPALAADCRETGCLSLISTDRNPARDRNGGTTVAR